jgi:hypothetical protein
MLCYLEICPEEVLETAGAMREANIKLNIGRVSDEEMV